MARMERIKNIRDERAEHRRIRKLLKSDDFELV
jgi:hypothetical protein